LSPGRRRFLQVGVAGATVLAVAHYVDRPRAPALPLRTLDAASAGLVRAIAACVLAGALPANPQSRSMALGEVTEAFDRAITGLAPAVRDEIRDLLGVLHFAPTRLVLAGMWRPLAETSSEEIGAFLSRWRESRFDLLRAGYQAITQLIQASWYDNPASWGAIGYPGPPTLAAAGTS